MEHAALEVDHSRRATPLRLGLLFMLVLCVSCNHFNAATGGVLFPMLVGMLNASGNIVVAETGGSTVTTEGGASDSYTVALPTSPKGDVIVRVAFDTAQLVVNGALISPVLLTFTAGACPSVGNWCTLQTVTVAAVDDALAETNPGTSRITQISTSTDGIFDGLAISDVNASITDNDSPGISVAQSGGSTDITEAGGTDSYTLVLTTQPTTNVTVSTAFDVLQTTINGSGVSPVVLTFTAGVCPAVGNWCTAQAVTVGAANDLFAESSPHTSVITHSAASVDPNYNALVVGAVSAAISDNDVPAITITQSGGSTDVTEAGGSDAYTAVLTTQPTSNVTVSVAFDDLQSTVNGSGVSPVVLTFTAGACPAVGNWCTAQTVTVTAVNDLFDETSPLGTSITHTAASTDGSYNAIAVGSVTVNVTDNETAAVTTTQSAGSTSISEAGATDTYTVVLTTQPTVDVTVNVAFDTAQTTINGSAVTPVPLTFTAGACPAVGNWCTAQTVTIGAVNDAIMEANTHASAITHSATSGDTNYNGIVISTVTANITDNDGTAGFTVSLASGPTTEGGGTATFTIVLNSIPGSNVTVNYASNDLTEGTTTDASKVFTTATWNVAQTVTITGADDALIDGNIAYAVIFSATTSSDALYAAITPSSVSVTNVDNEWSRKRQLTFDNFAQAENLLDFPVLVKLVDGVNIDYSRTQNAGQDLRFYDSNQLTLLPHQIEKWDESGTSYVWVKVPQIDALSSTDSIWMYYGSIGAADGQQAAATWNSAYKAVIHMNNSISDSTSIGNNGTACAGGGPSNTPSGRIGDGATFDGSTQCFRVPTTGWSSSFGTVEIWAKFDTAPAVALPSSPGMSRQVFSHSDPANYATYHHRIYLTLVNGSGGGGCSTQTNNYYVGIGERFINGCTGAGNGDTGSNLTLSAWQHLVVSWNSGAYKVYLNGAVLTPLFGTTYSTAGFTTNGLDASSMVGAFSGESEYFDGNADELRVSNVQRSDAWIAVEYKSMVDTLIAYGGEISF